MQEWYLIIFFLIVGGHSTFFALLNTFVHIVMYFYYMVAAMGPEFQKYIWWKKYLTTFQMVITLLYTHFFHWSNFFIFRSSLWQFSHINSNCSSRSATIPRVSWFGLRFTVCFSCFCFQTFTRQSTPIRGLLKTVVLAWWVWR